MRIKVGLIGIGDIFIDHMDALKANPEFELVSICRRSKEKVSEQANQLGCKGFTNYRDLLAECPDVVAITLPHALHCKTTIEALEAGCHVIVEKPMAISVDECRQMLRCMDKCGKHLIVAESASFNPAAVLTGQKFKTGQLGAFLTGSIINSRFYFIESRPAWFLEPTMSGGGMFANIGVHRLAIARAALPGLMPISVCASVRHVPKYTIEACTSAIVKYKDYGAMFYEEIGYFPKPSWLNDGTHFIFENGIVSWDNATWRMMRQDGKIVEETLIPNSVAYAPVYANMLRAIRGQDYGPKAWEYAVDTIITQAAYASSNKGCQIDLASEEWNIGCNNGTYQ